MFCAVLFRLGMENMYVLCRLVSSWYGFFFFMFCDVSFHLGMEKLCSVPFRFVLVWKNYVLCRFVSSWYEKDYVLRRFLSSWYGEKNMFCAVSFCLGVAWFCLVSRSVCVPVSWISFRLPALFDGVCCQLVPLLFYDGITLLGGSGGVVNSLDFCPASLKSLGCFYFRCVLSSHWKAVTVNLRNLHCQL